MTLDEYMSHLAAVRKEHGGEITVLFADWEYFGSLIHNPHILPTVEMVYLQENNCIREGDMYSTSSWRTVKGHEQPIKAVVLN